MTKLTKTLIEETIYQLVQADEGNLDQLFTEKSIGNMVAIGGDFLTLDKMPKSESGEKLRAFAESKPVVALTHLVQLMKKHLIDFECPNKATWFCSSFMSSLVNAMDVVQIVPEALLVAEQYVNCGGVALTCEVLAMRDHVAHKDDEVRKPNTAYNISRHLALLRKAYNFDSLQSGLGEILRENNYFSVLIPYATSKYVVLTMLIHYFTYLGIDFLTLH